MASEGTQLRYSLNTKSTTGSICPKHLHDVLLLFCNHCKTPICMTCLDETTCSDHQTVSMKKKADQNLSLLEVEFQGRANGFTAPGNIDSKIVTLKKDLDTVKDNKDKMISVINSESDHAKKVLEKTLEDLKKVKTEAEFLNSVKTGIDGSKTLQDSCEVYKHTTKLRQELTKRPTFQNDKGNPKCDVIIPAINIMRFQKTVKIATGQTDTICDSCNLDVSSQNTVRLACNAHEICMLCAKSKGVGNARGCCPLCPTSAEPVDSDGSNATAAVVKCPICLNDLPADTGTKVLHKCGHAFCTNCIRQAFIVKPVCPTCYEVYGPLTGTQPADGRMTVSGSSYQDLPGYPGCGTITINYGFSDGYQGSEHPDPGKWYKGIRRTAYLPNNWEGNKVARLLKAAFDARIVFTIGRSASTGKEGKITWNGIHHKTNMYGGPQKFGYPDPEYLTRVQEELAAKGYK